ncbi:MAG: histidinol dehydrogenase [Treponema sp.]|nr:histidinol dehydrogenase [Treponema sp.]
MKIIQSSEFDSYWKNETFNTDDVKTEMTVKQIIAEVREKGDEAVKKFASQFDKSSPHELEVSYAEAQCALSALRETDPALVEALELAARNIARFSARQKEQFSDFEFEMDSGLFTGQRVIPVQRAAAYIPAGRFPLFSSVLMCLIPAFCAGVDEIVLASPPAENGLPDRKILAAAAIAYQISGGGKTLRLFAMGGAQAIAALALGTESVPRVDVITGPGNKYVAAAKRILFGEVGIDFIAGPTDILIITDRQAAAPAGLQAHLQAADFVAADMLAQAEHDPDARSRVLVPNSQFANEIIAAIERRLKTLSTAETARASLDAGGLIVIYQSKEEAIRIANVIAPEHLELQTKDDDSWIPFLKNYGSLFIGVFAAEALGDYSAGLNHTLPTSTSARFTGGLSVRHFLKTVTTLRCIHSTNGAGSEGFEKALKAAETLARAEGLEGHAQSALMRRFVME